MIEGFEVSRFHERREKVLEALGSGVLVLPAAPILFGPGRSELRYRPDSELFYLSGFTEPEAVLVLRGFAQEDRTVLFCRSRDASLERWSGPRMGPDLAREALGLDATRSTDELGPELASMLSGADRVYFRLGAGSEVEPEVISALQTARRKGARHGRGPRGVLDPGLVLDDLRLRKDRAELDAVRRAVQVTVEGFEAALAGVAPGRGEWEIEADIEAAFRRQGAFGPAFPTIVGSGENACVLHHIRNDRRVGEGDLVLVDAGAEVGMYSGDLTRTVPAAGRFSAVQREVYEIVEAARREAVETVRPGIPEERVHDRALRVIVRGLRDLGVLSGSEDEIIQEKAYEPYFPHRTSHWLGLDTHDVGDYMVEGTSRPLAPGMVLTIEPGLYFPSDVAEGALAGIGVRIEDDVLVTEEGSEVLSARLPTPPDEVEALVGAVDGGSP